MIETVQEARLRLLEIEELIARSIGLLERSNELLARTAGMVQQPDRPVQPERPT